MEISDINAFSCFISELLTYLGCSPVNIEKLSNQVFRSMRKVKRREDLTLSLIQHDEHHARLCMDRSVFFNTFDACNHIPISSKDWSIRILSCQVIDSSLRFMFERASTFRNVMNCVLMNGAEYGQSSTTSQQPAIVRYNGSPDEHSSILSERRVVLAAKAIGNLLQASGYQVTINPEDTANVESSLDLYFTCKSTDISMPPGSKCVTCGVILNAETGSKETQLTTYDYLRQREEDALKILQERCNDVSEMQCDIETQIARAGLLFDLLGVKLSSCVSLSSSKHEEPQLYGLSSKGASFVLYNCARLASIRAQFQRKVDSGDYPKLPPFEEIDTSLLNNEEEWILLLHFIMAFPHIIKESLSGCDEGKPNIHIFISFLTTFCKKISAYYRRVRILTEPRSQLLPILFARIYFIQVLEQVLHNALSILDINPISQM